MMVVPFAAVFFLFATTRYVATEVSWRHHWNRLQPTLRGLGTVPAPEVTPIAWARHLAARRHEVDRFGKTPCDHTLNLELGRLKSMLDWAVATQLIAFNPVRAAKRLTTRSQRETKLRRADIDTLLVEAEGLRDWRLAEEDDDGTRAAMLRAAVLCWHDSMLRFNEGRHLRRALIEPNGDYPIPRADTKTDAGERTVTLTARTLEAIRSVPAHPESDYVFVNMKTGKLLSEGTLRNWFRWACKEGRLDARAAPRDKRICPHMLRHAGATAADEAGARPGALQVTMGHRRLATVERYLHRDKVESARHIAEIMGELAGPLRRGPKKAMGAPPRKVQRLRKSR